MALSDKTLFVCNCEGSMTLDGQGLAEALGLAGPVQVHTQLCRAQIDRFKQAASAGGSLLIGCTQEAPLFEETRADIESGSQASYVNLRERAGWSHQGERAGAKIAALLAEASLDMPATPSVTMESSGQCLVYGRGQPALDAACQLASRLSVTLMFEDAADAFPPERIDMPVFRGRITAATGHLGRFRLSVDGLARMKVSSRETLTFDDVQTSGHENGVIAEADLVLDLSGSAPLFPGHEKRDGYWRPDADDPAAVQRALFDLTDMVGTFEKPRYVDFKADLCAHSRNRKTGCTRCLDLCPAAAIQPDGDVVAIDPYLCGGCGLCSSVCPTGAAAYAYPPAGAVLERLRILLSAYRQAGGETPVLLIHDQTHGFGLISAMARLGRGLPAHVMPFAVNEVTQLGLETILAAFAYGAGHLFFVVPQRRRHELSGLEQQIGCAQAVLDGLGFGGNRLEVLAEDDPELVEAALWMDRTLSPMPAGDFLPLGRKRSLLRAALASLRDQAPEQPTRIALPKGAPFGRVRVDVAGCTLCLACVSACPTGALSDSPDLPQLRFQEDACVQCGLCRNTCPEHVITLEPGLSFEDEARQPVLIKEEEPYRCIRCDKPFGTKSSVEKIIAMLGEKHAMFQDTSTIDRIRMCEDCRVIVQFEATDNPLAGPAKPRVRTTDDYLREREETASGKGRGDDEGEGEDGAD